MLRHVTHYYFINFIKGLFPLASEAHCRYTTLHKYVITIMYYSSQLEVWSQGTKKHLPKLLPMLPQSLGPDMAWISGTPDRSSSLMTQLLVLLVESLVL